jgi:superfamily II DNA or RNA helicase
MGTIYERRLSGRADSFAIMRQQPNQPMKLSEYYEKYGSRISQDSERLFVDEFLYPLVGSNIDRIVPQHPFLDRTGRSRRMDFAIQGSRAPLALEVNGETYHAEGIIPDAMFDENLFRQNEILRLGYRLARFSYSQLKDPKWRPLVMDALREVVAGAAPELLSEYALEPSELQREALDALAFFREAKSWRKGVVVMPTGTGKTILSALDARRVGGKVLFLVHRLDILSQSIAAYQKVWPDMKSGLLTGEVRENEKSCDVLFASKDTLRQPDQLLRFRRNEFDYVVIDEVHHGQSPTYLDIIEYFRPKFMLGMTATPDRLDRKDIFELFDYNKVYEIAASEAIERGLLVPYTYYGLTDDVDYSKIRYENNRYRVDDLERYLIIPERNAAILREYKEKGSGDKAIGFCVSIKHAERMAAYFTESGIVAAAIHSGSPNRDQLITDFREDRIAVAFTVDLFNEGVDFPNVQVLLFLRPTESKTVFVQQLGRGLRLAPGKARVRVLDFIGNYKRANLIRDYLAKRKQIVEVEDERGRKRRKVVYEYSTGCEVHFDPTVEEILERQDSESLGVSKLELEQAYYALAEKLGRKPSRSDIDAEGEYRSGVYGRVYGSWTKFIREIGEYTEASYHYPQGTHVGHILAVLWYFGLRSRKGTAFDDDSIRLRGGFGEGRISTYRRQVKFKLQAAMELGILEDDRRAPAGKDFVPTLTPLGRELRGVLEPYLKKADLKFPIGDDGLPGTAMADDERTYNALVQQAIKGGGAAASIIRRTILRMPAVQQMLAFLYQVGQKSVLDKSYIYKHFFQAPFVKQFLDQEGIEEATEEGARHRCPYLLNLLEAIGVVEQDRSSVRVKSLLLVPALIRTHGREEQEASTKRLAALKAAWPDNAKAMAADDLSVLRELFGANFLTAEYPFKTAVFIEEL